ncbi:thioesterase family protein [Jatrophihabitans sp.]|uniref:thioesterase family protein n=1 Tax=Jatrophihabitans sp. TaxID=1932789 RepID=UPI002B946B48|nr:thioesterase family protein [Jatrophihabitans sp.]
MSDSHPFDADTAVTGTGPRFEATISDRWGVVGGHANGGYVLSVCLRALRQALDRPDPLAVAAFYQRRVLPGPAEVLLDLGRSGRPLATGGARLLQGGQELVRVVASFADLSQADGPTLVTGSAPALPAPDDCVDLFGELPGEADLTAPGITGRLECRVPRLPGWRQGAPSGRAEAEFWMRLAGGRQPDTMALPGLVDMAAPAVFELGHFVSTTIELSVHVRARPAPGWLACRVSTRYLIEGYHEEDFEIWDSAGTLVAQSRQLALLLS